MVINDAQSGCGEGSPEVAGDDRPWWWLLAPPAPHSTALRAGHQLPPCSPSCSLLGWDGKHVFCSL